MQRTVDQETCSGLLFIWCQVRVQSAIGNQVIFLAGQPAEHVILDLLFGACHLPDPHHFHLALEELGQASAGLHPPG